MTDMMRPQVVASQEGAWQSLLTDRCGEELSGWNGVIWRKVTCQDQSLGCVISLCIVTVQSSWDKGWSRGMLTCSFQACSLEKVILGSTYRTSPSSLAQWQWVAHELQCSEWTSLIDMILSWNFFWSSIFFLHTSSEWHVDKFLKLWVFPWEGFHHLTYLTNLLVTIITQNGTNFSIIKNHVSIIHWAFN